MALFGFGRGKEKKMVQKPVYVINGFLDSGKSSFFSYTLGQPYFKSQEKDPTLLILCEEGEVEYDEKLLKWSNTVLEKIENEADLIVLFRILPKDLASETFVEMEADAQELLIRGFSDNELKEILDELYADDAVDIVEELRKRVNRNFSKK